MCGTLYLLQPCKLLHVYVVLSWAQLMLLCVPADAAEPHVHHPPVGLLLCLCLVSMLCDATSPTAAAAAVLLGCIFTCTSVMAVSISHLVRFLNSTWLDASELLSSDRSSVPLKHKVLLFGWCSKAVAAQCISHRSEMCVQNATSAIQYSFTASCMVLVLVPRCSNDIPTSCGSQLLWYCPGLRCGPCLLWCRQSIYY
jgi:hypothetical protein